MVLKHRSGLSCNSIKYRHYRSKTTQARPENIGTGLRKQPDKPVYGVTTTRLVTSLSLRRIRRK